MQRDFIGVYERYARDVYVIAVVDAITEEPRAKMDVALGTAFAVSKTGLFLTAYHTIRRFQADIDADRVKIGLKGAHGHGVPHEDAFRVRLVEAFPRFDLALLQGPPRRTFVPTVATLGLPGAWTATIGYPRSYDDPELQRVRVNKRIVSAMIASTTNEGGVRFVELDKHLAPGQSGSPIFSLHAKEAIWRGHQAHERMGRREAAGARKRGRIRAVGGRFRRMG